MGLAAPIADDGCGLEVLPLMARGELPAAAAAIALNIDGRVVTRSPHARTAAFVYRRRKVALSLEMIAGVTRIELACLLARLPYTAEAAEERRRLIRLALRAQALGLVRIVIGRDRPSVQALDSLAIDAAEASAAALLAEISLAVARMHPVFDLFTDAPPTAD